MHAKTIEIVCISTGQEQADVYTKPLWTNIGMLDLQGEITTYYIKLDYSISISLD